MIETLASFRIDSLGEYDDVIDVRSPGEYAEDHVPGAINLPVMNDEQRAEIGTIYVQDSKFRAKRLGAAYVAENIAQHLRTVLADRAGDWSPLIYCWRGGQRSQAMATILSQIGWRVRLLGGGYKTYRRAVKRALYDAEPEFRMILLDGNTGTAKTEILTRLAGRGEQVLDLEGLARHRGSLFGGMANEDQPSQRQFESDVLAALSGLDHSQTIYAEAESSKIGNRLVPPVIWKAMQAAPRIEIKADLDARAHYLVTTYGDIAADRRRLTAAIEELSALRGHKQVNAWKALVDAGQFEALARSLIKQHYDPAYARTRGRRDWSSLGVLKARNLSRAGLEALVDEVMALGNTAAMAGP